MTLPRHSVLIIVCVEIALQSCCRAFASRGLRGHFFPRTLAASSKPSPSPSQLYPAVATNAVVTVTTTTTTTTTDSGPYYLITSSTVTNSIYSWNSQTNIFSVIVAGAGSNPHGIALDHNLGYLYYTDPGGRQIVRYEIVFRDGEIQSYTDQPVPIVQNVDAEYITVNDYSNIFWTNPVDGTIMKMYFSTIEQVASGFFQPNALTTVSYMDTYLQMGRVVPSYCYGVHGTPEFPANCTSNVTCNTCKQLPQEAYIYTLYSGLGFPSGLQVMPGNKLMWGNREDGFQRGTVVEAQAEPTLLPGFSFFKIVALTYLWNNVINFLKLPDTPLGQGTLFLTTNGTLGTPPIPGDVVGALVAITPKTEHGPSMAVPLDWNFDRPRSMAWNGHDKLYIADYSGVKIVNQAVLNVGLMGALETTALDLPGAAGLIEMNPDVPCYPMMVEKGLKPNPASYGL